MDSNSTSKPCCSSSPSYHHCCYHHYYSYHIYVQRAQMCTIQKLSVASPWNSANGQAPIPYFVLAHGVCFYRAILQTLLCSLQALQHLQGEGVALPEHLVTRQHS
eukprot:6091357-Amphidinium_carterae.1